EGLFQAGLTFDDISIKEPNLEDLFLRLTGRELRD
ncbi:ABC transporter ATP-binding protein, partial [bacterium]|nr:ABC transporter ATP-binding protein [bacterium]